MQNFSDFFTSKKELWCSRISLRLTPINYFGVKKDKEISISDAKILKEKQRNEAKIIHQV